MNKINDRGSIKWTAMMLPEHKKMLRQMTDKLLNTVEMPLLSEDKLEEFDNIIHRALHSKCKINITLHKNLGTHSIEGYISKVNYAKRSISLQTEQGSQIIAIGKIIEIQD